jgi:hypothetical protein
MGRTRVAALRTVGGEEEEVRDPCRVDGMGVRVLTG